LGTTDGLGFELIPEVPKELTQLTLEMPKELIQLTPEVPKELTQLRQTA
jgi:hypothetical protein